MSMPCFQWTYLRLLALLEERILTRLVGGLVLGEVAVLADLVYDLLVDTLQINLGGGSDNISCVYPSQRNAVDFERTGDEEDTLGKVLEENDTLAAETTSEEDDDGTGLERGPGFRRADSLASLESQLAELWMVQFRRLKFIVRIQSLQSSHRRASTMPTILLFSVHLSGVAEANVPSWGLRRPRPGSTCSPSGVSVPLCWPPFRIAVVVSCPGSWMVRPSSRPRILSVVGLGKRCANSGSPKG